MEDTDDFDDILGQPNVPECAKKGCDRSAAGGDNKYCLIHEIEEE